MYTPSRDGKLRCNINLVFRFTKEEIAEIKEIAKAEGLTPRKWLEQNARDGIYHAILRHKESK